MDRGLAVLLTAIAGGLIALQAPINAGLGKGDGQPAGCPHLVRRSARSHSLRSSSSAARRAGSARAFDVSWYYLLGGLLGAVYVTTALVAVSAIGAGGVAAATVTGQLIASVAIDRLGLFGLDQVALSPERVVGVLPAACRDRPGRPLRPANSGGAICR